MMRSYLNLVCECVRLQGLRSAVGCAGSAKMCAVKRSLRKSPARPLRRRRAQRHLDSLAQHPARDLSPTVAVAHVRVLGESASALDDASTGSHMPTHTGHEGESRAIPAPPGGEVRIVSHQLGAQLRAVPIDEPLASSL
jgi:hypothetical protein